MTERIIIAGAGGQGIMLLGKVLALTAMRAGKFVTWLPCYGAEVRGGTANCMVVVSDEQIGSPYIDKADTLIIMNAPSLEKFKDRLAAKGLLLVNSSLVTQGLPAGARSYLFTDIASGLGNIKTANMVALGCFLKQKKLLDLKTASEAILEIAPPDKKNLVTINQKALQEGAKLK